MTYFGSTFQMTSGEFSDVFVLAGTPSTSQLHSSRRAVPQPPENNVFLIFHSLQISVMLLYVPAKFTIFHVFLSILGHPGRVGTPPDNSRQLRKLFFFQGGCGWTNSRLRTSILRPQMQRRMLTTRYRLYVRWLVRLVSSRVSVHSGLVHSGTI